MASILSEATKACDEHSEIVSGESDAYADSDASTVAEAEAAARKEQRRMEGRQRAKEIAISRQKAKTHASRGSSPDRNKRHGARNQRRHKNFMKWLLATFPHILSECILREEDDNLNSTEAYSPSATGTHVLDVAGGKGELAARMSICHKLKVVLVDPREANVTKCYDDCVFKTIPKKYQERLIERRKLSPSYLEEEVDKYVSQLVMCFDENAVESTPLLEEAVKQASLIVGMHADGATEAIVNVALKHNTPSVVVPCCVFPNLFTKRFIDAVSDEGSTNKQIPVRTHEQFCEFLLKKDQRFTMETLPFEGRNVAIWWDGN